MRPELILSKLALNLLFKSGKNSLQLKTGDTVNAKIVKFLDNKQVLLNIKGTFVKAKLNIPVTQNTVKLYLKSLTPNVVFEILPSKVPLKATFIKVQETDAEKIIKEIIHSLSENPKLQKALSQNNFLSFLHFIFPNNELLLDVEWFDEKTKENENIRKLRLVIHTPNLKTSIFELSEYLNNFYVNGFFGNKEIIKIGQELKEQFENETGIKINFHILSEKDNEIFTKSLFNSKYQDTSFDLKI